MRSLFCALSLLTLIPVPKRFQFTSDDLALSAASFPLVGLSLGALLAGLTLLLHPLISSAPLAAILLILLSFLTGGLHLDGLADLADGLGAGGAATRRLAIMKESQIGAFGAIALVLALLLKFTLFEAVIQSGAFELFLLMGLLSRWTMVLAAFWGRYPRTSGTAQAFIAQIKTKTLTIATLCVLVISFALVGVVSLLLVLLLLVMVRFLVHFISSKLGGITGDVLGAVNEMTELVVLIFALYLIPVLSFNF